MDKTNMLEKIAEDNNFFKSLIDLIPARDYFSQDTKDEFKPPEDSEDTSTHGNTEISKKKGKGKKRKLPQDPLISKTVTQLQTELDERAADGKTEIIREKKVAASQGTGNLEELKEKLQARITELKGKRGHLNPEEWREKKRLKRKESKLKLAMRRKKEKINLVKGDNSDVKLVNGSSKSPVKPVYNKEGKIVFSKFDFTDSVNKEKGAMSDLTGKDYKKILENLEKRKEKIKGLQQVDPLAGRDLQKKTAWDMAINKAQGVKIKDDPNLLKKAIKRKEKQKEKTQKYWESQQEHVEETKKKQQEKRQRNIDFRKQSKFKNKLKKASKKGRIIPGF